MKMITLRNLVLTFFVLTAHNYSYSQCSDAGICSIGGHESGEHIQNRPLIINLSYSYGASGEPEEITYNSVNIGAAYNFSNEYSGMFTLPFSLTSGNSEEISGIGDLIVALNRDVMIGSRSTLRFSLGGKFATGKTDVDNHPLAYQNGLGTNDILFGVTFNRKEYFFGGGVQIPFGEVENGNLGYKLKRAPDAIVRGGFNFIQQGYNLGVEAMIIKRLTTSKAIHQSPSGEFETPINSSDFTQINLMAKSTIILSELIDVNFNVAIPLLKRNENSDGTKRALSVGIGLIFKPAL